MYLCDTIQCLKNMKYQKIFPKDWVDMHPYTTIDSVDQYYTKVASRVA